ncbi:MAG TPA: SURF1 family protein [Alphaproteobacteria bacterium]|nr:SURF1 family protein [Alphaproteobacteria bacterium]
MAARRFRPTLWATLVAIPALLILLGLGTWQLERLGWKRDLIARIDERLAAAPAPLPATLPPDAAEAWEFRRVAVRGTFRHEGEMRWQARTREGQLGVELITPLAREEGPPVLVNRGWVPLDRADPAARPETLTAGPVTVEGILRAPAERGTMQPDNRPDANQWFWLDIPAMAAAAGVPDALPVLVQAAPPAGAVADRAALPVPRVPRPELSNNHLQYALTWYGLAAALVAVYVVFHLRPRQS